MIKTIYKSGPYGDQCNSYDVVTDNKTVGDFIKDVLSDHQEWGYIIVGSKRIEYRYGKLIDKIPDAWDNRPIKGKVTAFGGWSRMDYEIS